MSDAVFATFGSGGAEPYARALRRDDQVLYLRDIESDSLTPSRAMFRAGMTRRMQRTSASSTASTVPCSTSAAGRDVWCVPLCTGD